MATEYTKGDVRNCRNCQQPLYFGGIHWWHKHNDSGYCFNNIATDHRQAEPDLDETERVRAAGPELLEALIELRRVLWSEGYADQTPEMAQADAAIRKAEGK
jgi:hypothetical protein